MPPSSTAPGGGGHDTRRVVVPYRVAVLVWLGPIGIGNILLHVGFLSFVGLLLHKFDK